MSSVENKLEVNYKKPIEPLDLCYTALEIPEVPRTLLQQKPRVMKFSTFISSKRYESIREKAQRVYDVMTENWAYCPTITSVCNHPNAIFMRWDQDKRVCIVMVIPDAPFAYSKGLLEDGPLPCHVLGPDESIWTMLPAFAKFVSPKEKR